MRPLGLSQRLSVITIVLGLVSESLAVPTDPNLPRLDSPAQRSPQSSRPPYSAVNPSDLVCRPFGECEPCPSDELDQPFCMPFGNRRLLHCIPASDAEDAASGDDSRQPSAEIPAWEACGKVIAKEKRDFLEFVLANILFLVVALTILWVRSSSLAKAQYHQLAARIGIPGGVWR